MATNDELKQQYIAARKAGMSQEEAYASVTKNNQPQQQEYQPSYQQPVQQSSGQSSDPKQTYIEARKRGMSKEDAYSFATSGKSFDSGSMSFTTPTSSYDGRGSGQNQSIIGRVRAAAANTDASKSKADKRLEKLLSAYGNNGKTYDDNFIGQFKANFGLGRISEEKAAALSRYMDTDSPEDLARIQQLDALEKQYRERNAAALDDQNVKAGAVSKTFANYLPQLWNQTKASAAPVAAGAAAGAVIPIPVVDTVAGVKAGMVAGSGIYSYNNMRGAAYGNLLESTNVSKDVARAAAEDEAIVSSVIEMGDTAFELFSKIPGVAKLFEKGSQKALVAAGKTSLKQAAKSYLSEIGQEYSEEFVQELVSIANVRRTENNRNPGPAGLIAETLDLIKEISGEAIQGNITDELKQANEAGVGGGTIAMIGAPIKGAAGVVARGAFNSLDSNLHENSLNTVLQEEVRKASQSEDGGQHAMEAYQKFEEELSSAKTGDVLYNVDDAGNPVIVGRVMSSNANGIVIQTAEGDIAVPNNFLTNTAIEESLNNGAKFATGEEATDILRRVNEKPEDLPFTFGKEDTSQSPQNAAGAQTAVTGNETPDVQQNATQTVKPGQNGQMVTSSAYRSTSEVMEEIRNVPNLSDDDLTSRYAFLGQRGYNMTVGQTNDLRAALEKELIKRGLGTDPTKWPSEGNTPAPWESESNGGTKNAEPNQPTGVSGPTAVPADDTVLGNQPPSERGNGPGVVSDGGTGAEAPKPIPLSRPKGNTAPTIGQSDGYSITQETLPDGSKTSGVRVYSARIFAPGENSLISDKDLTSEQRELRKKLKGFGFKSVHFFNTTEFYVAGQETSPCGGLCITVGSLIGKKPEFHMFLSNNPNAFIIQRHELTHMISNAAFEIAGKISPDNRMKAMMDLGNAMQKVVGSGNYYRAVERITKYYFRNMWRDGMSFHDLINKIKALGDDSFNKYQEELVCEIFSQLISGDNCYGAWSESFKHRAFANEDIMRTLRLGSVACTKDPNVHYTDVISFLEEDPRSDTSDVSQEPTRGYDDTELPPPHDDSEAPPETTTEPPEPMPEPTPTASEPSAPKSGPTAVNPNPAPTSGPTEVKSGPTEVKSKPETPAGTDRNGKSWAEDTTRVYDETKSEPVTETDTEKRAKEEFGTYLDDVKKTNDKFKNLKTLADKDVPEKAGRSAKNAATKLKEGMNELRGKLDDLVNGKITGDEFAEYYNRLEKAGNGMATYWDERVAARFANVLDALEEAKKGAKDSVLKYQGELTKAVTQLVHTVERVDKLNRTLANFGKSASQNAFNTKTKNMVVKLARAYLRWQINPTNVFRLIDGFDKDARGDGYRYARRIDDAVADYQSLNVEMQERLARIKKMETYKEFVSGKKMTGVKIGDTELNVLQGLSFIKLYDTIQATSPEKMGGISGFAIDMGNGEYEFVKNVKVNPDKVYAELKKSLDNISKEYGKAADEVFEALGKRIVKTAMAIDGVSPYMFSKGEYFPLWYKTRNDDMHTWSLTKGIDGSLTDKRFTHDRSSENPGYVVISPITKVVDEYITQGTNYAAFGELGNDLRLMNRESNPGGSLSQMMNANFGDQAAGWMENYIKDVNEIAETDTEGINSLLRDGRNALAQGALLFSPSVQMKQVASYWSAAGVVRMEALQLAWRFKELNMKGNGLKSALLRYRQLGNVDETLSEALQSGWVKKLQQKSDLFRQLSNMTSIKDVRTVDNVYTACVLDVIMDYPDMDQNSATFQKLVEDKFQNAVLNTQPIFTKQARAEYARTDNEVIRMMSMFRTQQTQNLNRLITTVCEYNASDKKDASAKRALQQTVKGQVSAAFSFAALSVAADLLLHRIKKYRDDDGNLDVTKFLERLGLNAVETGAATLWECDALVKWAVDQVTKKIDKSNATNEFYGVSFGAVSTLGDVVESIAYLLQSPSLSNFRYTVGYIGTLTGIPVNNIYAMINSGAMIVKDFAGENKDHYDDILKWSANERRPERQLLKSYLAGDEDRVNMLYESLGDKAESKVKAEVKDFVLKDDIGHEEAVNLLVKYGGIDNPEKADTEVKKYELLADEDINFNTLAEDYREHEKTGKGKVTRDVVMAARINVAGDTEEEAEQYVNKQDFNLEFGFSFDDIKSKYRAGKISADDAVEWRMKCLGVSKETAQEWVKAQDVFLETGYEYVSSGSASYYDSYATKETMGTNSFYDAYGEMFPSKKAFGEVFNDLDTNSKNEKYETLRNKYGDLGAKQTRVIYTLRKHIANGNVSIGLAKTIWAKRYGYSDYNWHFVTD